MKTKFLDEFSEEVWRSTYKDSAEDNIDETLLRVATSIASAEETEELKDKWRKNFLSSLTNFKLCAGGRILSNAGTKWKGTTLMNCFVGTKPDYDQDSIAGIFNTLTAQAQTLKSEGGWGMNFSFIRPRGSFIHGVGVESPGSVKYMELFDKSSDVITSGSGIVSKNKEAKGKIRKGAQMAVLDVWHPDIQEFITAKLTPNRLSKFNLSVNCSNAFMDRVVRLKEIEALLSSSLILSSETNLNNLTEEMARLERWELIFPDTKHKAYKAEWNGNIEAWRDAGHPVIIYKTINVSDLWELIMSSTYNRNDPGVLFLDIANKTHAWNYAGRKSHIAATNPCGEQCLPFGSVCNLGSLNLTQFINKEKTDFDYDAINRHTHNAVRFLDNVNSISSAPLSEYEEAIRDRRRIGLGVMGWGSALYILKVRFGSNRAEEIKAKLMREFTHSAVSCSIDLAIEKGMFKDCIPSEHVKSPFWAQIGLSSYLMDRMAKHGIRNSALFSIQPNGNTGILANIVTGGLEPVFMPKYIRTVIVTVCPPEMLSITPKYWEGEFKETEYFKFAKEGEDVILTCDFNGIKYKIDKNRGLTKEVYCIDYGVRISIESGDWDEGADWAVTTSSLSVEEHLKDLKGFGKWIDSSMSKTVNLPNDYGYKEFKDIYIDAYKTGYLKGITTYRAGTMTTVLSSIVKENALEIKESNPIKRTKSLSGELHHFKIDKHQYYVAVGLLGDKPFEVFTGVNEENKDFFIPKEIQVGEIIKNGRGQYSFLCLLDEKEKEYKLNNDHSDDTVDALTRLISCSLRHGCPIQFVIEQLQKTKGPITSFAKALARTLKKYIPNNTKSSVKCPDCNVNLIFTEGCTTCPNCGNSKCS